MALNVKDEILFELSQMSQYVFEPKTKIIEIQRKFGDTLNIIIKILTEITKLSNVIKSDQIVITEDDIPEIVARFNNVIDNIIQNYNNWLQMSTTIENNMVNLYSLNMDMQEIRIELSTLINDIVGGYSA